MYEIAQPTDIHYFYYLHSAVVSKYKHMYGTE